MISDQWGDVIERWGCYNSLFGLKVSVVITENQCSWFLSGENVINIGINCPVLVYVMLETHFRFWLCFPISKQFFESVFEFLHCHKPNKSVEGIAVPLPFGFKP